MRGRALPRCSGCSAMRRRGGLGSRNRGPPGEHASDRGTDERYQEHRHETGDDAQPLRLAKSAAGFCGSRRRIRSWARTPAHSESPFRLVKGGGYSPQKSVEAADGANGGAYCCSGLCLSPLRAAGLLLLVVRASRATWGRGQIWARRKAISRALVPPHYRKRQHWLSRFPFAGQARSRVTPNEFDLGAHSAGQWACGPIRPGNRV